MLTSISLYAFRNYMKATVPLEPGINLFLGANAQGKTNLLEAVYFAATSRSPRSALLADMVRWNEAGARVVLSFTQGDAERVIEIKLERDPKSSRVKRSATLDGKATQAHSLPGHVRLVLFHPEEMTLIRGPASDRRRLIDALLTQAVDGYAANLARYGRVLEQRNALLKRIAQEVEEPAALDHWTDELSRLGGLLIRDRQDCLSRLVPMAAERHREIAPGEELLVEYAPTVDASPDPAAAMAAELRRRLAEELARGVTVAGPHRDDLRFSLGSEPAAAHASQGQQRTAILSFKLAEVELLSSLGSETVLLLDDVMSELDAPRRGHLLSLVESAPQSLITSAEVGYFPAGFVDRVLTRRVVEGTVEVS